jgi:cobalt-zinc-cadmium efflux system protein
MHDHDGPVHQHAHAAASPRGLLGALGLTLGFALVEAVAGWWSGSLALLGDAGHMLTDSLALGLAAAAAVLARRAPSMRHSYGFGRAEILAALVNALTMILIVAWLSAEAVARLAHPAPVKGGVVLLVAAIGLLVNLAAAWLLAGDRHNLNVRAALLHVLGDLLGSVAALLSGAVILLTGWTTVDPLLSLLIVALILVSAVRVLREALHALMEGVPLHLDLEKIGHAMAAVDGVTSVHDLHVWSLSSSRTALSAHVVIRDPLAWPTTLARLQDSLAREFGIDHVTLQPEAGEYYVDASALRSRRRRG